jgi:ribonuclease HI
MSSTAAVHRHRWLVYTDGACAPTNPGPCGWGAVVLAPESATVSSHHGFIGTGTNQVAELTAAIEGLRRTPHASQVTLISDSQYVVKGVTEWRKGWERRGWRNAKGEPVANQTLWYRLFKLVDARDVRMQWVRGHNGDKLNEQADALANAALAEHR